MKRIFLLFIVLHSCTTNNTTTQSVDDVFVAGSIEETGTLFVWKNGKVIDINCKNLTTIKSLYVSLSDDIYIAGSKSNGILNTTAVINKNGNDKKLIISGKESDLCYINEIDSEIYAIGIDNDRIALWKNGNPMTLISTNSPTILTSAFVSNGKQYVVGYASDEKGQNSIAKLWINDQELDLTDGKYRAYAHSVYADNLNIYVVGTVYPNKYNGVATLWVNGNSQSLANENEDSNAYAVCVSGKNVYVVGAKWNEKFSHHVATFWENGECFDLTDGTKNAEATAIVIHNEDIYIAGYEWISPNHSVGIIWKNKKVLYVLDEGAHTRIDALYVK